MRLSFRTKMVLPAGVAVAATLVSMAIAIALMSRSADELRQVEARHYPGLRLAQKVETDVQAVQRQLQDAAMAEDLSGVDTADELVAALEAAIGEASDEVLPPDRKAALRAQVKAYYDLARLTTARLIRQEHGEDVTAALRDMGVRFTDLRRTLAGETERTQAAITTAFEEARSLQRTSVVAVIVLLLAAAAGAFVVAVLVAGSAARPLEELNRAALRVADGDLTGDIVVRSEDELGLLAGSFGRMVERLRAIVAALKDASGELASAAEALGEHTRAQGATVALQAASVNETSVTMRELEQASSVAASRAASVLDVARRAGEMTDAGKTAAERSVDGIRQIQSSVESILGQNARLVDQARQVGSIVETVRDLASQSHVLSLNASIEAARAGEAGRGFAVVAAEVRALAEQSGQSAGTIQKIVGDILAAVHASMDMTEKGNRGVEGSVAQIRASGDSLSEIGGIVRETSEAALQIAGAVQQQSQGITQIAEAMRDLDKGMEETVSRIQILEKAAGQLSGTATRISMIANGFKM